MWVFGLYKAVYFLILIFGVLLGDRGFAWGLKGHDIIAKLATDIYNEKYGKFSPGYAKVLSEKSELLGHLANIPDVYWKSLPKGTTKELNPTHYLDTEFVKTSPSFESFPIGVNDFLVNTRKICDQSGLSNKLDCKVFDTKEVFAAVGTVQFRIRQIASMMETELRKAHSLNSTLTSKTKQSTSGKRKKYQRLLKQLSIILYYMQGC